MWLTGLVLLLTIPNAFAARAKTDVVTLLNGDVITCEIKKLQRGKLTAKTSDMGTLSIKWDKIASVESDFRFQLELQSGIRYSGTLEPGDAPGKVEVVTPAGNSQVDLIRIVTMVPLEQTFFQTLHGSVDVGFDFTQANAATNWTLGADANYIVSRYEATASVSSQLKLQEGAENINRQTANLGFNWLLRHKWFLPGLFQFEKNEQTGLDARFLYGGGIGKYVVQSNRSRLGLLGGLALTRERYIDDPDELTNAELMLGTRVETFKFDSPQIDVTVGALFLPSLTTKGRYRVQINANTRLELLKDLFWAVNFYESFDSKPPSDDLRRNDFGITTSLGWSW